MDLKQIKKARVDKGLSQEFMARKLKITRAGYNLKETGSTEFKPSELVIVSKILGINIRDLFTDLEKWNNL